MEKPFNKKSFLAEDSIDSMAAIHCKTKEIDGVLKGIIRISDCNGTIRLHNDIEIKKGAIEHIHKIDSLINNLMEYKEHIVKNYL